MCLSLRVCCTRKKEKKRGVRYTRKKGKKENRGSNIVPQLCHVSIVFPRFPGISPLIHCLYLLGHGAVALNRILLQAMTTT